MNRYSWQKGKTVRLVILLTVSMLVPAVAFGQVASIDSVDDVKAAFDEAMNEESLQDRISLLEQLEQDIDQLLFEISSNTRDRVDLLSYKFKVQQSLAEYPESRVTFGQYIAAVKNTFPTVQAETIVEMVIDQHYHKADHAENVALIDEALDEYANDLNVTPFLLLRKAQCVRTLHGRLTDAYAPLEILIAEYPDSKWRPMGMRLLSIVQLQEVNVKAALATLSLLESQYRGTWYEHYAHMKPAAIMEKRQGNPEGAMSRYNDSLQKFSDHCFGTYIRKEIKRLQEIVEQQLIDQALQGLAQNNNCGNDSGDMLVWANPSEKLRKSHISVAWCFFDEDIYR